MKTRHERPVGTLRYEMAKAEVEGTDWRWACASCGSEQIYAHRPTWMLQEANPFVDGFPEPLETEPVHELAPEYECRGCGKLPTAILPVDGPTAVGVAGSVGEAAEDRS